MDKAMEIAMHLHGASKLGYEQRTVQTSVKIPVGIHARVKELAEFGEKSMNDMMVMLLDLGADALNDAIDHLREENPQLKEGE